MKKPRSEEISDFIRDSGFQCPYCGRPRDNNFTTTQGDTTRFHVEYACGTKLSIKKNGFRYESEGFKHKCTTIKR